MSALSPGAWRVCSSSRFKPRCGAARPRLLRALAQHQNAPGTAEARPTEAKVLLVGEETSSRVPPILGTLVPCCWKVCIHPFSEDLTEVPGLQEQPDIWAASSRSN